jgi:hypothetical protein
MKPRNEAENKELKEKSAYLPRGKVSKALFLQ